jgi:V/A-type H+-transporting ATPase subunit E
VADGKLVVDLSDDAVAGLLLQHLQPRFRAILEGIVRIGGRR